MNYRKEIDGLRAFAVVSVILFHAGIQTFSGGFIGVDVFFVISGYLITSIIVSEKEAGTFTLLGFYERRARRILPALCVVLVVCLPFAWLRLLPSDMRMFSQSLFAISVFASNIYFWLTTGYFGTSAHLTPLLHTWSLAVEEQYYLIFPVLLLVTWRFGKRWTVGVVSIVALISLSAAQWGSSAHPAAAFYLLPTRGWELLLGALIALYLWGSKSENKNPKSNAIVCEIASLVGLALITYGIFAFDKHTPFPGVHALAPTIGTALVILCGNPRTLVGKFLSTRLLVGIGLISYGIYLWHYPLFAFARLQNNDEPTFSGFLVLVLFSIGLAYLSWRYVEFPFRDRQRTSRRTVFSLALICSATVGIFGIGGHFTAGFPNRLSPEQQLLASFVAYDRAPVYRDGKCFLLPAQSFREFASDCGAVGEDAPIYLIWGDSFAAALSGGFRFFRSNVLQYTASACAPIVGVHFNDRPHCREINEFILKEVGRTQPDYIVLHAMWSVYNAAEVNHAGVTNSIDKIRKVSPKSRIFIVGSVPQWSRALPEVLLQNGIKLDDYVFVRAPVLRELEAVDAGLRQAASINGIEFLSALERSCIDGACQGVTKFKGIFQPTAWDIGHLTEGGAVLLAGKLLQQISGKQE